MGVAAISVLLLPARIGPGAFVWNATPSAPLGLYRIEETAWSRGDRVAVRPSDTVVDMLRAHGVSSAGRLLIKRVAGMEGDVVCRESGRVTLNGVLIANARPAGSRQQPLPQWSGCRRLGTGDVFLLGETDDSFDARYLGVSAADDIVGRIEVILRVGAGRAATSRLYRGTLQS